MAGDTSMTPPPEEQAPEVAAPPPLFTPEVLLTLSKKYIGLAEPYSKELGALIQQKIDDWNSWIKRNGMRQQWCDNFSMYHNAGLSGEGGLFTSTSFNIVGNNGELVEIRLNSLRNLLTHLVNLTVSQPPAMMSQAMNEDPDTMEAAKDFDTLIEYYQRTWASRTFEKVINQATEQSTFLPFGAIFMEWDPQGGKPYISDELGRVVREGDVSMKAVSVFDVIFDTSIERESDLKWFIVRDWENRVELAARYPDHAKDIAELPVRDAIEHTNAWGIADNSDMVCVWKFFHLPTLAVPEGRLVISVDPDIILHDGPNPYDRPNVFFIRAADGHGTLYGYAPANDLVPVNLAENMMVSALVTNYAAGGTQNIAVKAGDEPAITALSGGLRVMEYVDTPPQAISLVQNAPGSFEFLGFLRQAEELLSGINAAARGDPQANVKSGKMQGMLQALAVQFANKLQRNYAGAMNDVGNFLLYLFQRFAASERVTKIIGKDKVTKSIRWSGQKFNSIDAVVVEQVDPAMRTLGFKMDQAEKLLANGAIVDPFDYAEVMETGNLRNVIKGPMAERDLIGQENSDMLKGVECPVLVTDTHQLHIQEHQQLLYSANVRRNSPHVQLILAHMQQHMDFVANMVPGAQMAQRQPMDKEAAQQDQQQQEQPVASTAPPMEQQQSVGG